MAYGWAWDMKEQGAIGKTGHQWGYFSLSGTWDRKWALGKMVYRGHGICEKYPFEFTTPHPHRTFLHYRRSSAQRTEHQHSLPGGHEEEDDEEYDKIKESGRVAHMGRMAARPGSGRLDPGDFWLLVSLGSAWIVSEGFSFASHHPDALPLLPR